MAIFICGFMGSGKTTFSNKFSGTDLDKLIKDKFAKDYAELGDYIRDVGWKKFRDNEAEMIKAVDLSCKSQDVVALGGGALELQENVDFIKSSQSKVIWLDVSFSECFRRIKGDKNRPILDEKSENDLKELFERRKKSYSLAADFVLTPEKSERVETLDDLLKILGDHD